MRIHFFLALAAAMLSPTVGALEREPAPVMHADNFVKVDMALRSGHYEKLLAIDKHAVGTGLLRDLVKDRIAPGIHLTALDQENSCRQQYRASLSSDDLYRQCLYVSIGNYFLWGRYADARQLASLFYGPSLKRRRLNDLPANIAALLQTVPSASGLNPAKRDDLRLTLDGQYAETEITAHNGVPTIIAMLDIKGKSIAAKFVIDTAASNSALSYQTLHQISGIAPEGEVFDETAAQILNVSVNDVRFINVLFQPIKADLNILGLDVLRQLDGIKLSSRKLQIWVGYSPHSCNAPLINSSSPVGDWSRIAVPAKINNVDTDIVIDTGASFDAKLHGMDMHKIPLRLRRSITYLTADGARTAEAILGHVNIQISGQNFPSKYIGVGGDRYIMPWSLGYSWLSQKDLYLNIKDSCYSLN
ncbi:hypothetical protein FZ025_01215 [Xanthomonas hyacinthi]|uniref:hypothetical protein n=1 Tax=Xanthomonas hyacinthi TaxID=56455 RepID=UPI000A67C647|nr:hypothetical protein [Xanthomonas hyacinthi]QGY75358.1 hypothetical protein FZ025_01215 [Xanthomonas hyacinthi]